MKNNIKCLQFLIIALASLIALGLVVSFFVYRSVFDGPLSKLIGDWGAFGSYFGGVFSPVIAFATLIAIIITIHLQKQLLETQNREFTELCDLQQQALAAQKKELGLAAERALEHSTNEQKKLYMGLIEQQIDIRRSNMERAGEGATLMMEKKAEGCPVDDSIIVSNIKQKELHEKQVQVLTFASIGFALTNFESIADMEESITKLFKQIDSPGILDELYDSERKNFDYGSE